MNAPMCKQLIRELNSLSSSWAIPGDLENDVYILPVSGGADSTALAIALHAAFPDVHFEMVFSDTGAEEDDAYASLHKLEDYLGKKITWIKPKADLYQLISEYGGFLPSANSRFCTRELKLLPFREWLEQFKGTQKWMFVGIRADESSRVAFTIDECETVMPFVEWGMGRERIFQILSETVGIPKTYQTRTRSGCGVCPFVRKSEIVGLLQRAPNEFARGEALEKLSETDICRQVEAVPLWKDSGIAANWQSFPQPKGNLEAGKGGGQSLFATAGVFIGAEFFIDGWPGMEEFTWHQRLVSFSTTLSGIKKQLDNRYKHLLRTGEVYGMSPDDVRSKARFAIYFVEAPLDVFDPKGPHADSYTWQSGMSYKQVRHVTSWATRMLHAAYLSETATSKNHHDEMSWGYEQATVAEGALQNVKHEVGAVVASGWYVPAEPVASDDEDIEEQFFPCPMCQI